MKTRFVSLFLVLAAGVAVGSHAAPAPVAPRMASAEFSADLQEFGFEGEDAEAGTAKEAPQTDKKKGAKLQLSADNINFGDVLVGQVRKKTFKLKNVGGQTLVVQVKDSTDAAFIGSPLNKGLTIKPGKSRTVHLEFTPSAKKEFIGKIPVEIISPGAAKLRVRVRGKGI